MSSGAQLSEADGIRRNVSSELTIVPHVRKLAKKSFVKSPKKYRGKKLDASGIVIVGKGPDYVDNSRDDRNSERIRVKKFSEWKPKSTNADGSPKWKPTGGRRILLRGSETSSKKVMPRKGAKSETEGINSANNGTESEGGRGGNWTLLPNGGDKVSRDQDRRESDRIMFNPIKDQCLGECRSSESIKVYGGPTAGRDWMAHNVEHREVKLGANRVYNPKCRQNELLARGYAGGWQVMKIVNGMEVRRNSVEVEVSLSTTEVLAASEQVAKLRSWDRREMSDMRGAGKWEPEYTVKNWTSSGPIGGPKVPANQKRVESKNM
ncbi:hypothetical protein B0H10DRAFT_1965610 [Mycena sp. CBHHK59/15]|nr:hypothetical protein B0H10DRAFT_1965610 [Mycena sp. CBHHK59/15]